MPRPTTATQKIRCCVPVITALLARSPARGAPRPQPARRAPLPQRRSRASRRWGAPGKPGRRVYPLAHYLTEEYLTASFRELKKSAASGIDGKSASGYETNLQENIKDLQTRLRNKSYKAPNIRRVWIDKGGGKQRPLGISTLDYRCRYPRLFRQLRP